MKNNSNQAISLPLNEKELSAAAFMEYSAATMMIVVSKKLRSNKAYSSPASPSN